MKCFIWYGNYGVCLYASRSFARGFESEYGPYDLWFERLCWPIYKAVTPPFKSFGVVSL